MLPPRRVHQCLQILSAEDASSEDIGCNDHMEELRRVLCIDPASDLKSSRAGRERGKRLSARGFIVL